MLSVSRKHLAALCAVVGIHAITANAVTYAPPVMGQMPIVNPVAPVIPAGECGPDITSCAAKIITTYIKYIENRTTTLTSFTTNITVIPIPTTTTIIQIEDNITEVDGVCQEVTTSTHPGTTITVTENVNVTETIFTEVMYTAIRKVPNPIRHLSSCIIKHPGKITTSDVKSPAVQTKKPADTPVTTSSKTSESTKSTSTVREDTAKSAETFVPPADKKAKAAEEKAQTKGGWLHRE